MIENHSWFLTRRLVMPSKFLLAWLYSGKLIVRKLLSYLNKQNVCISYEDISRHNRKWEAAVLVEESRTTTLLKQLTAALITSMLKQNLYSFILLIQIFSNPIRLLHLLFRWFKSGNPWKMFIAEQQKKLHPSQLLSCRVRNPSPTLKTIICHNCWRRVSPWLFYGQLLEELLKQRRISFHWWVPRLYLTNKYLLLIKENLL